MKIAKILLVDDEKGFLDIMTKRLENRELEVVTAGNGPDALKILAEDHAIDVVVLDVKMPIMDGIETLRKIKRDFPLAEVIMLTGHATVETGIEGMKLGAFDYLMKPCDIGQLTAKVAEAKKQKDERAEKIVQAEMREISTRMGYD